MKIERMLCTIGTFRKQLYIKYRVPDYNWTDKNEKDLPLFVFGYYLRDDHQHGNLLLNHRGFIVIVWSGSDSMDLDKKVRAVNYFRENKDRIKHIAYSHWIIKDLEAVGLEVVKRAVFPTSFEWLDYVEKHQGNIYHYHPRDRSRYEVYGTDIVNNLEKRNSLLRGRFVKTAWGHVKPKSRELFGLYAQCFVGIRLTEHDNMALSCVEMGVMGRPSIFNGNIPCAINYTDKTDATKLLVNMAKNPPPPSKELSDEMKEFVFDDLKWLDTNYYL